ncbi:MAG: arsenate reductase (glutaredoxin) [Gammaproteobacteria bacterium]|nr:arsenate reductase (glutaredoxin) [Gammaproteobacteria bacterium]
MNVTIYHNPRCSKSRQALELLRKHGIEPTIVEYLKNPPGKKELKSLLERLGMSPRDLMRRQEAPYRENGLDDPKLGREQLIAALAEYPILIERPIVVTDAAAVVARPPEKLLDLL